MIALPQGWRVEMLGLANAVKFTLNDGLTLLWCDGVWTMGRGSVHVPCRTLPHASTMKEARAVGTAWIIKQERDNEAVPA